LDTSTTGSPTPEGSTTTPAHSASEPGEKAATTDGKAAKAARAGSAIGRIATATLGWLGQSVLGSDMLNMFEICFLRLILQWRNIYCPWLRLETKAAEGAPTGDVESQEPGWGKEAEAQDEHLKDLVKQLMYVYQLQVRPG
jgi:hypothetical protein